MDERVKKVNRLIYRISKNDIAALDDLFNEVGGLLFSMAKKYLVNKSLAEDLVSDIFTRLVSSARSFDVKRNGLNWLYKSIRNQAINWNKKIQPSLNSGFDDENLYDVLSCLDSSIDTIVLRDALKTLSTAENKILYHKFWEGLTVREIAKITKTPRSTVQDAINKSLEKIKRIIK